MLAMILAQAVEAAQSLGLDRLGACIAQVLSQLVLVLVLVRLVHLQWKQSLVNQNRQATFVVI